MYHFSQFIGFSGQFHCRFRLSSLIWLHASGKAAKLEGPVETHTLIWQWRSAWLGHLGSSPCGLWPCRTPDWLSLMVSEQHSKAVEAGVVRLLWAQLWKTHNVISATGHFQDQPEFQELRNRLIFLQGGEAKAPCTGSWEEVIAPFCNLLQLHGCLWGSSDSDGRQRFGS